MTGKSSAKITSQHTLRYADLIRRIGVDKASLYADANRAGVQKVQELAQSLRIACDLETRDAYAYTVRPDRRNALQAEAAAARRLGLPAEVVARAPLPFANAGALRFGGQAQFNPVRYLTGLARGVADEGGRLYQHTRVNKVVKKRGDLPWTLVAGRHRLHAREVVVATHLPLGSPVQFDTRTRPRCHIAMAFRAVPEGTLDGMFIGVDAPAYSLRMARDRKGPLLIVLAPKFATGWEKNVEGRFAAVSPPPSPPSFPPFPSPPTRYFFFGTFAPAFRASERPIAIACLLGLGDTSCRNRSSTFHACVRAWSFPPSFAPSFRKPP